MVKKMLEFIQKSPCSYLAVENVRRRLQEEGYRSLRFGEELNLQPGGKYYFTKNGAALIAFRIPYEMPAGFTLAAAHTDSPCFKLHEKAERGGQYVRLVGERYGGMLNDSWLDRPLSVAGRLLVRTDSGLAVRLVDLKEPCALIPRVAIHFNRGVNDGAKYDPAQDLVALFAEKGGEGRFEEALAMEAGCQPEDIVSRELVLYNAQPGYVWGPEDAFVSAPRLDDLACAYTCLEGFLAAQTSTRVPVLCLFDNEEIGSGTKQGAESSFLADVLETVTEGMGLSMTEHRGMLENSWMLSCDNGHAIHPNHPEKSDAAEAPVLNGGVVLKHAQKYATDGLSAAVFSEICRREEIPVQHFANRPDIAGGGTLGNIAATKTPIATVDIGMAQLAMHSSFETAGARDVKTFAKAVRACYEANVDFGENRILL